jgi:hypothetical protein
MQEVNLKKLIFFNLFYLHFCLGSYICIGNSSLRDSGVMPGVVVTETYLITRTSYFGHTSLKTFSSQHAHVTRSLWLRQQHGPLKNRHCWALFVSTGLHHLFRYIIQDNESRICVKFLHPHQIKNKPSYNTCIQSRDMICKFWCHSLCFMGMYCRKPTLTWEKIMSTAICSGL